MTRKILSSKVKKNKDSKQIDGMAKGGSHGGPQTSFLNGVAINPFECINLESGSQQFTARAIDLIAPVGLGQRGLIVAPPGCGKTTILKHICQAVGEAYPKIKLYALLIDERPEEVTDFKRSVPAEVHASSSDDSYEQHVRVANDLLSTAIQEAGEGHDVMIVIDSLTRLTRVHNAGAMEIPRKLFGAARKIENGGSLTILATVLVDTGSQMDQVIFEEFKGTGNMEIVLSRDAANLRIFPALDIAKSSTRREELLLSSKDLESVRVLRRAFTNLKPEEGTRKLVALLEKYPTNAELLNITNESKLPKS
jgi:transcription termination factor Rho